MKINPNLYVKDLLLLWQLGEECCDVVIGALADDHPAMTAFFINEGCTSRVLTSLDVNRITNALIDMRTAIVQQYSNTLEKS